MVEKMLANHMSYPLHIGITEAGEGENGRIKSALGICSLLNKGIGDTLRVSLTEDPEHEIPFAKKLSSLYQLPFSAPGTTDGYKLHTTRLSGNDITITDNHHKAIVISSWSDEQAQECQPDSGNSAAPQNNTPDFFFTENPETPSEFPSLQFILPHDVWELSHTSNSVPLFDISDNQFLKKNSSREKFLLQINNEEITPRMMDDSLFDGLMGIVIDIPSISSTLKLGEWIALCQQKKAPLIFRMRFSTVDPDEIISRAAALAGNFLIERKVQGLWLSAPAMHGNLPAIAFGFLQSSGVRITRTEFISCPTCARTSYNLQQVLKDIQKETSHLPGLKVAVMGCIVNGPGEMADADYGFVGTGTGKLHLYKGQTPVKKNIEPGDATTELLSLLRENGLEF